MSIKRTLSGMIGQSAACMSLFLPRCESEEEKDEIAIENEEKTEDEPDEARPLRGTAVLSELKLRDGDVLLVVMGAATPWAELSELEIDDMNRTIAQHRSALQHAAHQRGEGNPSLAVLLPGPIVYARYHKNNLWYAAKVAKFNVGGTCNVLWLMNDTKQLR